MVTKAKQTAVEAISATERAQLRMQIVMSLMNVGRPSPWTTGEIGEIITQTEKIEAFVLPVEKPE